MDTSALKPFAQTMRTALMAGVRQRMQYWGFASGADPAEELEAIEGGYLFRGEVHADDTVPGKWKALRRAVQQHSVDDVVEEAAYTWFNRLLALRVLEKNGYLTDVLAYAPGTQEPALLHRAKQGLFPDAMREAQQGRARQALLDGDEDAAFRRLLVAFCHGHDLLNDVFGRLDDYTELLLPTGLLDPDGLLHRLLTTGAITDADYGQVELIGWLYQFYISEKKDAVYASKKKFRPEDIPAATQIFTPHWIVRYLVENTLGRLWLDKHPESAVRGDMDYLVSGEEGSGKGKEGEREPTVLFDDLTELQLFDPAAGSGHILVVGFDLLMRMYREAGYPDRQAVQHILRHNLKGLDLDRRAAQLARFALLMKAAAYDRSILTQPNVRPEVYAMPEPRPFSTGDLRAYLGDEGFDACGAEVKEALDLLRTHGPNVGAALKLELSDAARDVVTGRMAHWAAQPEGAMELGEQELVPALHAYLKPLLLLTGTYPAVAMNPPYVGSGNMKSGLKEYVWTHYPRSKNDLYAVFMEVAVNSLIESGIASMINQQAWMFLKSFSDLREEVILRNELHSMLHLGINVFEELGSKKVQSTAFSFSKRTPSDRPITIHRLVEGRSLADKKALFLNAEKRYVLNGQSSLKSIPGSPISYWLSDIALDHFEGGRYIGDKVDTKEGMTTSNNARFIRTWSEVSGSRMATSCGSLADSLRRDAKWCPYEKGGKFRKWYGNLAFVVNWENDGREIRSYQGSSVRNDDFYFKEGLTWSGFTSKALSVRWSPAGRLFASKGPKGFADRNLTYYIALLNSIVGTYYLEALSPTLDYKLGHIDSVPLLESDHIISETATLCSRCIDISVHDWKSRETSWDFAQHPLAAQQAPTLEAAYDAWRQQATDDFFQLHANEEALNRLFIGLYGLEEELSPCVALDDITILEDELDRTALAELDAERGDLSDDELRARLPFLPEVPIRQFLSYGIGVMLGRYRLGHGGLHIAHPAPSAEELAPYVVPTPLAAPEPSGTATFAIDDDAILPLMGTDSPFSDDAVYRMREILRLVWGEDALTANLNFINRALSEGASRGYKRPKEQTMESWLVDEFWDYHKKLYSVNYYGKKPIYWLFASPEGHFQVLVYMHRMTKYTVQQVRQNYLHTWQQYLRGEIDKLAARGEDQLSGPEAKRLDTLRAQAADARAYDALLKAVADQQIAIDLDDGVQENYPKFGEAVAAL